MLEVKSLTVRRDGRSLLQNIDLCVPAGAVCVLVGPNGAGKSTLLKAIAGEISAAGEIVIFERPRGKWRPADLAPCMAVLPQQPSLSFDFLVKDVVALGRSPHRDSHPERQRAIIADCLERVGLGAFASRRYLTLSGGEKARAHLARALAQVWDERLEAPGGARVLLLDEPTAALDISQQVAAMRTVRSFAQRGGAALVVLHDLNLALGFADRLIVMKMGGISYNGSPKGAGDALRGAFGEGLCITEAPSGVFAHPECS
ncbi:MAG: heme ABC transporter ATP-binding protein [Caulobacterales bacterium]|jgi:iron complex transport system ATP-binding protein